MRAAGSVKYERNLMSDTYSPDCFVTATHEVGEDHEMVRWMLRRVPDLEPEKCGLGYMQFSGWLFMTGEDEGDVHIYYLKDIVEHNPDIIPYLTTEPPCRLERDGDLAVFYEVPED
jgi:hypothetical protein